MASRKIARDIFTNVLLRFYNNKSCHNYPKADEIAAVFHRREKEAATQADFMLTPAFRERIKYSTLAAA
jgi:hypothetical protein